MKRASMILWKTSKIELRALGDAELEDSRACVCTCVCFLGLHVCVYMLCVAKLKYVHAGIRDMRAKEVCMHIFVSMFIWCTLKWLRRCV